MTKIMPFAQLSKITAFLAKQNMSWHFHMLGKKCIYNTKSGKYAIIVEDEKAGESGISYFAEKPLSEAKKFAELLYGKGFLQKEIITGKDNQNFLFMYEMAKKLKAKKKGWHHHHFPPGCEFNRHGEKHCIVLEVEGKQEVYTAVYDKKPLKDLLAMEILFYKGK